MCSFSCLIAKVNYNVYARAGWLVGQFRAQELFSPVEQQADCSGVAWTAHHVRQSADIRRDSDAYGKVKHFLAQLDHPLKQCRTAGKHDARREQLLKATAA
jgi:hypothetical protein